MALTTNIKDLVNRLAEPLGLKIETRILEKLESNRLDRLREAGYFEREAFPVPACMQNCDWSGIAQWLREYQNDRNRLKSPELNDVGFSNGNAYFHPPDSDILYVMVRGYRPGKIVEIGSGNSTRVMRQAIRDGKQSTRVVSIDPMPRSDIAGMADDIRRHPVEEIPAQKLADELNSGDILFIDSSHLVSVGNDCVYEFLELLPRIPSGVIVHVHDISLPWDYPADWIDGQLQVKGWAEQYLLQAILMSGDRFEVLWPGYYLQRTQTEQFRELFPNTNGRDARSFWFRSK